LRQGILNLDPALGSSAQLARALYDALGAGVESSQAVKFVGDAAMFAKAGLTDASVAVKVMTAAMDAYGMSAGQAREISDALFTGVRVGKGEVVDLANNIGSVFPVAQTLGFTLKETTATVAALTRVFPSTSEAVTGFRSALANIITNVDKFKAAGIDMRKIIAEGGIVGAIDALREATGGAAEKVREFIPDIQGQTAVIALMGPQYKNLTQIVKEFGNTSGATHAAFEKQQKSLDAATQTFLNTLDRLIQKDAPQFLATMTQIVEALSVSLPGALEFANAMFRSTQGIFNTFVGVLIGGVSQIVGHLETLAGAAAKIAGWVGLDGVSAKLAGVRSALGQTEQTLKELGAAGLKSGIDLLRGSEQGEGGQKDLKQSVKLTAEEVRKLGDGALVLGGALIKAGADGKAGLDQTAQAAQDAAQKVQAAYDTLGLKTPQVLKLAATHAVAAFEELKASGTASQEALAQAAEKTKAEIVAAYGKVPYEMQPIFFGISKTGSDSAGTVAGAFESAGTSMVGSMQRAADEIEQQYDRIAKRAKEIDDIQKNSLMNQKMAPIHTDFASDRQGLEEQLRDAVRAKADVWRVGAGTKGYYDFAHKEYDKIIRELESRIAALDAQEGRAGDDSQRLMSSSAGSSSSSSSSRTSSSGGGGGGRSGGSSGRGGTIGGLGSTSLPPSGGTGSLVLGKDGGGGVQFNNPQFIVDIRGVDEQMINSRNLVQQLLPELRRAVAQGELENTSR
jgi:TP901 family phage tail tape measure protein